MVAGNATILIVEDEFMIAYAMADVVHEHGHEPLGPVATLEAALELVGVTRPDAALLNLVLNGVRADPLCEILDSLGVPFGSLPALMAMRTTACSETGPAS